MLVFYDEDSSYIHVEPTKDRTTPSVIAAYEKALSLFSARHGKRKIARLDNETSGKLETYLQDDHKLQLEFVPPGTHRALKAERVLQTWKNHFISLLAGTDPQFPLEVYDELIPQGELTLNLLRPSNADPSISAWEYVRGPYDFEKHPIAPAGIKVIVHKKKLERATWSPHGV